MINVIKMDRVRFFRDVKFELYDIFKEYDFKNEHKLIERKFFYITHDDVGTRSASLRYIPIPIDDIHIKYFHKPQRLDLTRLAKYVGMEILKKCEQIGSISILIHDYNNFTNHDQVYLDDIKPDIVEFLL